MKKRTPASRPQAKKATTKAKTAKPSSQPTKTAEVAKPQAKSVATSVLKVGQKAPAFSLLNDKGEKVTLTVLKGKKVVLYFYPKDDTSGCTKEACAFRDGISALTRAGAVVLGVSPDSVESHVKFSKKYDLNFRLLSDVEKTMLTKYGVWKEKSMYGRKYMGVERTTFIIDAQGKIAAIFPKVKVDQHYEEVLTTLQGLS
ncbi:MAG: thioredoxin-dependent thiol peroxidase [Nitrospirales bacterium]|nr:thioredoxin-dependent thiol peroxidase [Nitrospira sp.]MDR4501230.1 thioredoxin-dependent thiol peroxidase [Nitrospirales bacterium]